MARSSAAFADGALLVAPSLAVRLLGLSTAQVLSIDSGEILGTWRSDARFVGHQLRWRIAGTAVWRQRAMGWFSWIGHRGRWAWVWLTPGREVIVLESTRLRPALVVLPLDWFDKAERVSLIERLSEWGGES